MEKEAKNRKSKEDLDALILGKHLHEQQMYNASGTRADLNKMVAELNSINNSITQMETTLSVLEAELDVIEAKPVHEIALINYPTKKDDWYNKYAPSTLTTINGWVDYIYNAGWESTKKNSNDVIKDAVWQMWIALKDKTVAVNGMVSPIYLSSNRTTKTVIEGQGMILITSYQGLLNTLGKYGLLNKVSKKFVYPTEFQSVGERNWYLDSVLNARTSINGWCDYIVRNKWQDSELSDSSSIIRSAVFQMYEQIKKQGGVSTLFNVVTDKSKLTDKNIYIASFGGLLSLFERTGVLKSGIKISGKLVTYREVIPFEYSIADWKEYVIYRQESSISFMEETYNAKYKAADELRNTLKIQIFNPLNRYDRQGKREERREARSVKREARRRVGKIIWRLENKYNPFELEMQMEVDRIDIRMDYITKQNKQEDEVEFVALDNKGTELLKAMDELAVKQDALELELKTLADKYNFAERKEAKYYRKDARITYRQRKRNAKKTYKELYGKGWRVEGFTEFKTDIMADKLNVLDEYGGAGTWIKSKILYQVPRQAFHLLLAGNMFDVAGRILRIKNADESLYKRIVTVYRNFGGNESDFNNMIEKFGVKTPIPKYGSPLGKITYPKGKIEYNSCGCFNAAGVDDAAVASILATATPIIVNISQIFVAAAGIIGTGMTMFTGDKEADESINPDEYNKNFVAQMDITEEQRIQILAYLEQGYRLEEAVNLVFPEMDTNYWLIGGIALASLGLIGLGLYYIFGKK